MARQQMENNPHTNSRGLELIRFFDILSAGDGGEASRADLHPHLPSLSDAN